MKLPRVSKWMVESSVLDLAASILMSRWIRKRGHEQSLRLWQPYGQIPIVDDALGAASGANNLPFGKHQKIAIVVDLIRRFVGSQAFFFLVAAMFNKESWLNREIRRFSTVLCRKRNAPARAPRPRGVGRKFE